MIPTSKASFYLLLIFRLKPTGLLGRRSSSYLREEGEEEEAEEDSTGGDTGQSRGKAATAAGADTVLPKLI